MAHAAERSGLDGVVQRRQATLVEPVEASALSLAALVLGLSSGVGGTARLQQGKHAGLVPLSRRPRERRALALVQRAELRPTLDQQPHLKARKRRYRR